MAFKIYRLLPDHRFWKLTPPSLGYFQPSIFACARLEPSWPDDPAFGIENPSGTVKGDFVNFEPGTMAFGETVYESELGERIAYGGEILSGHIGGSNEPIFIYNALTCYNCLDSAGCIPALDPDQVPGESEVELVKYAFHPERIGGSSLFKVPEAFGQISFFSHTVKTKRVSIPCITPWALRDCCLKKSGLMLSAGISKPIILRAEGRFGDYLGRWASLRKGTLRRRVDMSGRSGTS